MSKTGNFWSKNQSRQWAWGRKRKWTHTDWTKGKCIMLIGITYIQYHMYSISTYKQCNWLIVRCIMSPLSFRGVALDRLSAFQAHSHSVQSNTHICREIGCSPLLRHGVNAHCIYGLSSAVTRSYRLLVAWLIQVLNDVCVCVSSRILLYDWRSTENHQHCWLCVMFLPAHIEFYLLQYYYAHDSRWTWTFILAGLWLCWLATTGRYITNRCLVHSIVRLIPLAILWDLDEWHM